MQPAFCHLRLHTEYSIVDGLVRIKQLLAKCQELKMPAVAVTDLGNFFGLVKFYKQAINNGIKPIIGTDLLIYNDEHPTQPSLITLLCQNHAGYKNITNLISQAYTEGQHAGMPMINREWLWQNADGIIVLSGAQDGEIGKALLSGNLDQAKKIVQDYQQHFSDRFYLEIQRVGLNNEERYIDGAIGLATANSIPIVATNNVRFLNRDDFEAHETRVCVNGGNLLDDPKRPHLYTEQQYFRSAEEMVELFSDLPEALINSVEIAKRCNLELALNKVFLPNFPIPTGNNLENYFAKESQLGFEKRDTPQDQLQIYNDRLTHEIKVINQMGFAGYFLIVADFIRWAKENNIPVGPGRGSGAGSLVAYALGITDLDPMQHDLLFERFLNPERVSMPDFDIDFCMDGRDRVIEYVMQRYGRESVAQIITFGTMAAKAVVRDVGRVLGFPYGFVDKIAKLIPFEIGITLEKAMEQEVRLAELYQNEEDVKTLIDLALKLEGITRNVGKHAGGVVIAPSKLTDFTPLYCEENQANLVTQFDMGDVETIGLVKFDFLGLRTLTIIDWTLKTVNAKRVANSEEKIDITKIPLDDTKTFDLFKACIMTAVFQLDSRMSRDLVKRLQPDQFNDIVALEALIRPGPQQAGMVDDYIERKHGRAQVSYLHPALKPVLAPTYGVILYQEQVMQIAQVLAGYSLGSADLLRRAMGKKKPEEMAKQRATFIDGAAKKGVDKHLANHIFDLMEKFAGYGFNKSHSAGYALITYQTAWLKAHYPAEFMAAVLSSDMDNTDKMAIFVEECRKLKLTIRPPHVNYSEYKFTVNEHGQIVYGLGAIKGVGETAAENIIADRKSYGDFKNLFALAKRVDIHKVNKRTLESLIKGGALDGLEKSRGVMLANVVYALQTSEQIQDAKRRGQHDLFVAEGDNSEKASPEYDETNIRNDDELLIFEHEVLGVYLSGHPLDRYRDELNRFVSAKIVEVSTIANKTIILAGVVAAIKIVKTRQEKQMAIVTLDDNTGRIDITIFSELFLDVCELLVKNTLLVIEGELSIDKFTDGYRIQAKKIFTLDQARENYAKCLVLKIDEAKIIATKNFLPELSRLISSSVRGNCRVVFHYRNQDGTTAEIKLGDEWKVMPSTALLNNLQLFANKSPGLLEAKLSY